LALLSTASHRHLVMSAGLVADITRCMLAVIAFCTKSLYNVARSLSARGRKASKKKQLSGLRYEMRMNLFITKNACFSQIHLRPTSYCRSSLNFRSALSPLLLGRCCLSLQYWVDRERGYVNSYAPWLTKLPHKHLWRLNYNRFIGVSTAS